MRLRSIAVLLTALTGAVFSAKAESLSILAINAYGCEFDNNQYEFAVPGWPCSSYYGTFSQSGGFVTISTPLVGPDPGMDTVGSWTFDVSQLRIDGLYAYTIATAPVKVPIIYDENGFPVTGEYTIDDFTAYLYEAGVPLQQPVTTPEPASYALMGAGLGLVACRGRRKRPLIKAAPYQWR